MVTLNAREGPEAEVRRDGVERLAAATRALADAVAVTAVDRATLDEVTGALELLTQRLALETDDDGYSGLLVLPVDPERPETYMPLNPIIGGCSPVRPDVEVRIAGGEVIGTATFTRRFVGPAGHAHGGISAMLADQLVAAAPMAIGERTVTKSLTIRYLRALPLDEEVELWGVCTSDGEQFKAKFEVRARGEIAVAGTAVLVPYKNLAKRAGITREGKPSPRSGVSSAE
ncbi:MAG TPA: PaaI family thioesterase [Acidimicrobiia bacterium]|nr:PaaI family thioesterase [Acidimicrobiia bacterium]